MVDKRPPEQVMTLARMGAGFPTRLSFMRTLLRRLSREDWRFERLRFDLDGDGYGTCLYAAHGPERSYTLVCFSHYLEPEQRTDRVIATAWDATFNLFDGIPSEEDVERLCTNTPKQEAGRFLPSELCLARANKSLRLFEHVASRLATGKQPDLKMVTDVGYLMRTTAVYGSGKFGCGVREKIANRPETMGAFQAEMLTVYLIRWFTIDLVEHVASMRGGEAAAQLSPAVKRFLGIGNSTGLGMAPFIGRYPVLVNSWVNAREEALARVRTLDVADQDRVEAFRHNLSVVRQHVEEWNVADQVQSGRIDGLRDDLAILQEAIDGGLANDPVSWDAIIGYGQEHLGAEAQELLVSMTLEVHGDLVDDLCDTMTAVSGATLDPAMSLEALRNLIEDRYQWALQIDFDQPQSQQNFWYYSEDKLEPRFSDRYDVAGSEMEMPLAIGRDVRDLLKVMDGANCDDETVAGLLLTYPKFRHVIRRIQMTAKYPYGEIYDNLIGAGVRPIDMLRFKLAFFGAAKFDPKSDLWTRITMYQGAPMPDELDNPAYENWTFPVMPRAGQLEA